MSRVPPIALTEFVASRITREQLGAVVTWIGQHFDRVDIDVDGYEVKDISDLDRVRRDVFTTCRVRGMSGQDDWAYIRIGKQGIRVMVSDADDPRLAGIFDMIPSVLFSNENKLWSCARDDGPGIGIGWFAMVATLAVACLWPWRRHPVSGGMLVGLLALASGSWVYFVYHVRRTMGLYLSSGKPSSLFLKRNRDAIIVGVVVTIIGALISFLLSALGK